MTQAENDTLLPPTQVNRRKSSVVLFPTIWDIQLRPIPREKKEVKPKV